jgi:hypothetical protein
MEAVDDLESARLRIQQLSSASYDEYLVFSAILQNLVSTQSTGPNHRQHHP